MTEIENPCTLPTEGWRCTRGAGHSGPCAAVRTGTPRGWSEDREPTSEELADYLKRCTDAERVGLCERIQPMLRKGVDCLVRNHDSEIGILRDVNQKLQIQLSAVRSRRSRAH